MPASNKKTVKRTTSQKRAGPAAPRKPGKRKKTATRRDLGHALLLTAILIAVSAGISAVILGIKGSAPDNLSGNRETIMEETIMPETNLTISRPDTVTETIMPETNFTMSPPDQAKETTQPEKVPASKPAVRQPVNTPPITRAETPPRANPPIENPGPVKPQTVSLQTVSSPQTLPLAAPPEIPKPEYQGTLVFVIDDAGNNLQELEPFLRFPGPLTIAVLPGLPHSVEAARRIRAAGKEVFLHQPMEALGGQNPGPGAIYAGMNAAEITAILNKNLAEIGPVAGMNNHQGSKITMDREAMKTILAFCREKGIYFLDSRTTTETAVPAIAQNMGIKIGERHIFIDNEQNRPAMSRFIENGLALAAQRGSAVMIGHTWSPELAPLLGELHRDFTAQGYTLTTASELIKR